MALIICPECGKEISNKAKCCIHCGYPLDELQNENQNVIDDKDNLYSVKLINCGGQKVKVIRVVREVSGLGLKEAKDVVDNLLIIKTGIHLDEATSIKKQLEEVDGAVEITHCKNNTVVSKSTISKPTPKCPTCGSTNIEKISAAKKVGGSLLFGIFSSDMRNSMHCKDCGYKW